MKLDTMRTLIEMTPGPTAPDIDTGAREWLGVDVDALLASAGSWAAHRVKSGAMLGPISHVYSANLCM